MSFFNLSPEIQQRLAIFVPLVALVLSLFVVYPAWGRYGALNDKIAQQQRELSDLKRTPVFTPGPVKPAEDYSPTEPPTFLAQIKKLALEAHCAIPQYDISDTGKVTDKGPVRAYRAQFVLEGAYVQIRDFLYRLNHADRLYVVTDLTITSSSPGSPATASYGPLRASIEIERYVAPTESKT
jgi:hypothetical protein